MNGKERIAKILKHQPVDRIGIFEHFWNDTQKEWAEQAHINKDEDMDTHFKFDMGIAWCLNLTIDLDFEGEVVAENENTITFKDGNGAILKKHKKHDSTPEHVDFTIKCKEDWDKYKHKLVFDVRRIDFNWYRRKKTMCEKNGQFFCLSGVNVFEAIHPICGHENMLVGMALEPEWIEEMVDVFSKLIVELQEYLFQKEGYPDGIWYYEDMGYKGTPFMSPDMYVELIQPGHKYTIDYAHSKNMPVIMHSCGFIEPLLPYMIEAGIDALQVIEIKAGMDLIRIYENFGDKIALIGGIDVRVLYTNDFAQIDKELETKIPIVKKGFGYVAHSDHSIPNTVNYETFNYYIEKLKELGSF
jgi:uroporphyrinogen decarboxylase